MAQHEDPRLANLAQPVFPPPGFTAGKPLAPHLDPGQHDQIQPGASVDESDVEETDVDGYGDYFGTDVTHKFVMPDGKQWIEFKELNEGDIARYQNILNRDVTVLKQTGDARLKINQVEERHALLVVAVTNWFMVKKDPRKGWLPVPFSNTGKGSTFMQWLNAARPQLVADLEEAIRKANPYLLAANNDTLEAIDKQIAQLQEQREQVVARMSGEGDSATS
jgi:hypothetical protein